MINVLKINCGLPPYNTQSKLTTSGQQVAAPSSLNPGDVVCSALMPPLVDRIAHLKNKWRTE